VADEPAQHTGLGAVDDCIRLLVSMQWLSLLLFLRITNLRWLSLTGMGALDDSI
jgi:hypothetical protein